MESVAIIIPARYASSRFPGKPLADILGKPMIQHVYEKASVINGVDVIVATDDARILSAVESFGGRAVMTRPDHISGTDRLVEVMDKVSADVYINLQGDEPLIRTSDIQLLINKMLQNQEIAVGTLYHHISFEKATNPNTVKVVTSHSNKACYFSRSPIPYIRNEQATITYKQHIGIYGYRKSVLEQYPKLKTSNMEAAEQLEQLRLLDSDIDIYAFEVAETGPGVDTPEDLERVIAILNGDSLISKTQPLAAVNFVITDIDGVLTDGGIYYDASGECLKRFHVRDGLGIKLLQQAGVKVAVLSGRDSAPLRKRISDLGIDIYALGVKDKETACQQLMQQAGVVKSNTLYIGDDTIDLPAFKACGIAATVADAPEYIKFKADIVLKTKGGFGAFREIADAILIQQGNAALLNNSAAFLKIHNQVTQ